MLKRNPAIEVSVVVPVRNEEDSIRALLDGLLNQTLAPKEIIITDGGSTDATILVIEEFIERGAPIKLFREQDSLPGRARNVGAKHARCEWIAFTDAGTRPGPDWLASIAGKVGDDSAVDVVYGSYEPVVDSFFKECAAIAYVPPAVSSPDGLVRPLSIVSALMRRTVWESVGGFPEDLRSAEDLLFMRKVEQATFHIARAPEAVVYWNIQPSLWRTFKRFTVYARNNIRAGLWREWQAAIFQRYAILALIALAAIFFGAKWLIVPFVCWLVLLIGRAVNAIRKYRIAAPAGLDRNILRLFVLVPIIAALDLAAFVGSITWLLCDKLCGAGGQPDHVAR
jgi:glycosyltransferase involved in cell wall biosynthesis